MVNCPVNYGTITDDSALQGLIGEVWNLTEEGTECVNVNFWECRTEGYTEQRKQLLLAIKSVDQELNTGCKGACPGARYAAVS